MTQQRQRIHFLAEYLANPVHPITVDLVGCGGSGSIMLSCLANINSALQSLGRKGLDITAYDNDTVTEANLGRQLFSRADLDCNKADALVTRFNRIYGTSWESVPEKYKFNDKANIIITCTDNIASRQYISRMFNEKEKIQSSYGTNNEHKNYYWLDMGNTQSTGQAVLGSKEIHQPTSAKYETVSKLPTVTDMYKFTKKDEKDSGPSCSLAEALNKQDLFINRIIATQAADILWRLLKQGYINIHGFFTNLDTSRTIPIEL